MFDKIVAIDIDDTILPRGGALSERTKAAVARARAEGVCVVIATGRGYHGSSGVLRELDADGLVINYGGAMINEAKTGRRYSSSRKSAVSTLTCIRVMRSSMNTRTSAVTAGLTQSISIFRRGSSRISAKCSGTTYRRCS